MWSHVFRIFLLFPVKILSMEEVIYWKQLQFKYFISQFIYRKIKGTYIGLSDRKKEGTYVWSDGTSFNFAKWTKGEPNNRGGNEDCIHTNWGHGSSWNDVPCSYKYNYICKFSKPKDKDQFVNYGDDRYSISNTKKTWQEAEKDCVSNGGHLASIHSKEENEFIYNELVKRWVNHDDVKS